MQYQVPIRVRDEDQVSTKEKQLSALLVFYRSYYLLSLPYRRKNENSHIPHKNNHTCIRRIIKRSFMSSPNFFYVPERPLVILDFDIMDTLSIEFYTTVPSSTTFFTVEVAPTDSVENS